jgi:hypothetical protein
MSGEPSATYLNLNNISTVFHNNGISDIDINGNLSGFIFPRGSGRTAIFSSGLLWGARVPGDDQPRVGGSVYASGLQGGKILSPGIPEDPEADHVRIYRVRPDVYPGSPTIDLSVEANEEGLSETELRAQYELDWVEWRATDGAPFEDIDGNGSYNSSIDVPGVPGASQTIWFAANDLNATLTSDFYGSLPLGIEYQATYWAYNYNIFLDNVFFRKYRLINKSETLFNDMYISFWSDPDIGSAGNDLVGCDTTLNLAYAYNASDYDSGYDPYPPPAIGFDLLRGPITSESDTLPMTAYYFFYGGDPNWADPPQGDPDGAMEFYNFMQGRFGRSGEPFMNPFTAQPTTFAFSGDPLTEEGWIDGVQFHPGDRRMGLASGPFNMAVGDTQDIVIAEIAALGSDRLNSLRGLKFYDAMTQDAFDNGLNLIPLPKPPAPVVTADDAGQPIEFNWGSDAISVDAIENFTQDGYTFQGYNVYQFPNDLPIIDYAVRVATYDIIDGVTEISGLVIDPGTGLPIIGIQQHGSDSGTEKVFNTSYDYIENEYMKVGKKYYFAITAYTYNPDPAAEPNNSESIINIVEVIYFDDLPGASYGDSVMVIHTEGNGNADISVKVEDPVKLTGDDYEVSFNTQQQIRDPNGNWIPASTIIRKFNPDDPDSLTGTEIDIAAVYAGDGTNIDLLFHLEIVHHFYGHGDGVTLTFAAGINIIEVPPFLAGGSWNGEPVPVEIVGNVVRLGITDNSQTWSGVFHEGGEDWIVRVDPTTYTMPLSVDWEVHDDGYYGYGAQNELGTTTVYEIGYASRLAKLWNVTDITSSGMVLENQSVYNGIDRYPPRDDSPVYLGPDSGPIADGFQINVDADYEAPIKFSYLELTSPSGLTILSTFPGAVNDRIGITNYSVFGGTFTSKVFDNFGVGTNEVSELGQDYELRFTGILDTMTLPDGRTFIYVSEGGSMATIFRIQGGDFTVHPSNTTGAAGPFQLRIPFEVWNIDGDINGEPYQVNLTFRDRVQNHGPGGSNPLYSWNLVNRMYACIVNSPYSETQVIQVDGGPDEFNALATWVLVFWGTNYHMYDIVTVHYNSPILFGVDKFSFTTPEAVDTIVKFIPDNYQLYQNYPNPFNPSTTIRFDLPREELVKLEVYDILGQRITRLIDTKLEAGRHEIEFSGRHLASGVYIYLLNVGNNFYKAKKMILLK